MEKTGPKFLRVFEEIQKLCYAELAFLACYEILAEHFVLTRISRRII